MKETSKTIRTFSYEEKTEQVCVLKINAEVLCNYGISTEIHRVVNKFMIKYPEYNGCLYEWDYNEDKTFIVVSLYTKVLDFEEL